jgi:hypothetical protein
MDTTKPIFTNGFSIIKRANVMQPLSENDKLVFEKCWIYPASGAAAGLLVDNAGDVYVGKTGSGDPMTPDKLAVGALPVGILLAPGQKLRLKDILLQGANVGDGVFFTYT